MKPCTRCKAVKPPDGFHRKASSPNGLHEWCKACMKSYQQSTRDKIAARKALKRMGASADYYEKLLAAQDGKCAICRGVNKSGRRLAIDHDHRFDSKDTAGHRGLLCQRCNVAIGMLGDSEGVLTSAAKYLHNFNRSLQLAQKRGGAL